MNSTWRVDVGSETQDFSYPVLRLIAQVSYFHLLRLYAGRPMRRIIAACVDLHFTSSPSREHRYFP
jgi:hypothetical protein